MKCDECNGILKSVTGDLPSKSKTLGKINVPNISYTKCNDCGATLLSPEMAEKVTAFKKGKERELINKLPIGEFLSVNEVIDILNITKQAFSKNNKIKRGFIYYAEKGKKKLYHKKSVELFKETGDGRFLLEKQQPRAVKLEFTTSYNACASSSIYSFSSGTFSADVYLRDGSGRKVFHV